MSSEQHQAKALERLLRQSFRTRTDKTGSGSCLDAETLASWADGTLAANDLAAAETHASSCDRCVALLAAMERATPPSVSTRWWSYSPMSRERRGAMGPRKRAAWSGRWGPATKQMFRWLVPLTAAVTVVAVWIAVPRDQRPTGSEQMAEQIAAPAETPAPALPADSSAVASPGAKAEAPSVKLDAPGLPADSSAVASPGAKAEARSAKAGARGALDARDARSGPGLPAAGPTATTDVAGARGATGALGAGGAAGAIGGASESNRAVTAGEQPARMADEQSARRESAPAPPSAPAAAPINERIQISETIQTSGAMSLARRAPIQIISPNRLIRWRATGSFVERSTDGGATWTATSTQLAADLTAGVSPSPSVVWLVGSGGTVLLSTDGIQFRVVPFPERINLTAVHATDARNATVTTSDGRTFATADGGVTWFTKP